MNYDGCGWAVKAAFTGRCDCQGMQTSQNRRKWQVYALVVINWWDGKIMRRYNRDCDNVL